MRDFYGNVVAAVRDGDPESTSAVLRAVSGDAQRIATALEAALVIYFVDAPENRTAG